MFGNDVYVCYAASYAVAAWYYESVAILVAGGLVYVTVGAFIGARDVAKNYVAYVRVWDYVCFVAEAYV